MDANTNSCIFKYILKDSWGMSLYELKIYDSNKDNIIIFDYDDDEDISNYVYTLSQENMDKIKSLFIDKFFILKNEDIEEPKPIVLDGFINSFYFFKNNLSNEIAIDNLWVYLKEKEIPSNVKLFVDLIDDLIRILFSQKIPVNNLKLDI